MDEKLPEYLDGPKFWAWLQSEGIKKQDLTDSCRRRLSEWEKGARANIYTSTVDQLLTDNYLSSRLIPDDVWSEDQTHTNTGKKMPYVSRETREQRRHEVELMLIQDAGQRVIDIAKTCNVSKQTVSRIKRELKLQGLID